MDTGLLESICLIASKFAASFARNRRRFQWSEARKLELLLQYAEELPELPKKSRINLESGRRVYDPVFILLKKRGKYIFSFRCT
jgi:sulfur transfer protein SufE